MIVHLSPVHRRALRQLLAEHIGAVYHDTETDAVTTPRELLLLLSDEAGLSWLDAFIADADEARTLYATMRTPELHTLRAAHELDAANAQRPATVAFSGGRIALIIDVLKAREAVTT